MARKPKIQTIDSRLETEAAFFKKEEAKFLKLMTQEKLPGYGNAYFQELAGVANKFAARVDSVLSGDTPLVIPNWTETITDTVEQKLLTVQPETLSSDDKAISN